MTTIKSFTDISQSKHLLELGLNPETADMYWSKRKAIPEYTDIPEHPEVLDLVAESMGIVDTPAWSLAALLSVLPDELEDNHFLTLDKEGNEYCCCYEDVNGNSFRYTFANNPVDACVAMIEKLHELKIL